MISASSPTEARLHGQRGCANTIKAGCPEERDALHPAGQNSGAACFAPAVPA
ncbi:hypothetical protein [Prosthecobacter sp.]